MGGGVDLQTLADITARHMAPEGKNARDEFYITMVAELMNSFFVEPERSAEFDPDWMYV